MRTWTKVLLCIALSFVFGFTCIGYAALTTTLTVDGTVEATPYEGLFITNVELVSSSVTSEDASYFLPTNVSSTIRGASGTTVTYRITVFNNTPYTYAYAGLEYERNLDGYGGNAYINQRNGLTVSTQDSSYGTLNGQDVVAAKETFTFYATYTIGRNAANRDLKTLINYKFGVNIDSVGQVAIDSALAQFEVILNDVTPDGGYYTLIEKIDDKYSGADWSANFIGNVVGAEGIGAAGRADTETINRLFDGKLKITIDGVETNVTVLIKRENVDNNTNTGDDYVATNGYSTHYGTGCEMTLYLTTDDLDVSGANVSVYAAVFTCDKNDDGTPGTWYQVGDLYQGQATVVGYVGNTATQNYGSFDTGTWRSTRATYTVTDDYRYTVANSATIQTITQATDRNATNLLQTLLTQANDVINGVYGSYAGEAMVNLEAAFAEAARCYTIDNNGNVTVNNGVTRSQVIPHLKALDMALVPFESLING